MPKQAKTSPKTRRRRINSPKSALPPTPAPDFENPNAPPGTASGIPGLFFFSRISRAVAVGAALLLGGYLIETHQTLNHALTGLALWAVAVYLSLAWFSPVPGAGIFPMMRAPEAKGTQEWSLWKITLVGFGALAALGLSNYFLGQAWVWFLLFSLLVLGWCLTLLEGRCPRALGDKPLEPAPFHKAGFPWAVLVILLVGSFFLFYGWDLYTIGYDSDSIKSLELADAWGGGGYSTPYVDGGFTGRPIFPYFLLAMFFKVVGCTYQKGDILVALLNLAGYLFFYGFARFYLSKAPALAATLLLCASHWALYPARVITGGRGMLVPFECALLFFFARALEKGKARDYALFGAFLVCSLLISIQGWFLLLFFILAMAALLFFRRPVFLRQKKSWIFAWSVAFLWYLPMFLYYQKTNPWCFPIDEASSKSVWNAQSFFIPWGNFRSVLQNLNFGYKDPLMAYFPLLSPWEGLFLLAGLGWCLWRFFKLPSLFIILGLLGGFSPAFVTNYNTTLRSLAAVPFVFLLVGIGLDRLTSVLAAPLGHRGGGLRFLIGGVFLALAVGWQYDIFFNHLPRYRDYYWIPNGRIYLYGTITAKHLEGWNTYVDLVDGTCQHPEFDYFYSKSDMEKGQRIIFHPDLSSLPLKSIPPKGALILLPDQMGKAFEEWIAYYYPESKEQLVLNAFGDIEFRLWEITPDQIQKALALPPGQPPGTMVLSWFDSQNRKLGQWQVPTFSETLVNEEWYLPDQGKPPSPWEKTSYFTVQGILENPAGKVLALQANGSVDGSVGGEKIQLDGRDPSKRLEIPLSSKKPEPFKIRYVLPKDGRFDLNLLEKTSLGWDMIPPSELRPQAER